MSRWYCHNLFVWRKNSLFVVFFFALFHKFQTVRAYLCERVTNGCGIVLGSDGARMITQAQIPAFSVTNLCKARHNTGSKTRSDSVKIKLPGKGFFIIVFIFHTVNPHICVWAFWPVFVKRRDMMQHYLVDCWTVLIEERRVLLVFVSGHCQRNVDMKRTGEMGNSRRCYYPFTLYTAMIVYSGGRCSQIWNYCNILQFILNLKTSKWLLDELVSQIKT